VKQLAEPFTRGPLDELYSLLVPRTGGVRIVLSEIGKLSERSFTLKVGEQSSLYSGTNSVALTLLAGAHDIVFKAHTSEGQQIERQVSVLVEDGRVNEVPIHF
jgi:hypothetical protein